MYSINVVIRRGLCCQIDYFKLWIIRRYIKCTSIYANTEWTIGHPVGKTCLILLNQLKLIFLSERNYKLNFSFEFLTEIN